MSRSRQTGKGLASVTELAKTKSPPTPKALTPPKGEATPPRPPATKRTTPRREKQSTPPVPPQPQVPSDQEFLDEAAAQNERDLLAALKQARANIGKRDYYIALLHQQIKSLGAEPVQMPQGGLASPGLPAPAADQAPSGPGSAETASAGQ